MYGHYNDILWCTVTILIYCDVRSLYWYTVMHGHYTDILWCMVNKALSLMYIVGQKQILLRIFPYKTTNNIKIVPVSRPNTLSKIWHAQKLTGTFIVVSQNTSSTPSAQPDESTPHLFIPQYKPWFLKQHVNFSFSVGKILCISYTPYSCYITHSSVDQKHLESFEM
jgi:hypothetical protein